MAILPSDRDQTTTQPILCNTSNGQPTFSVPELLHTFDALIVQSRSEIDEYLSRHPKLASNIRSLQSISAATISNDLPTPPPESPPPEKVGAADCRTCVSDDAGPKTNIQPLPGRSEYRTLRPLPSETPNPSVADPVSHDDSRKSLRKNGDVNAEVRLEKTKRSYAQLSDDGLKRDYILAKAAADVVANELTAPDTLIELREVILQERNRMSFNAQEPLSAFPKCKTESEGEVAKQLECLHTHFEKLRQNEHIKTTADRYHSALIVQLYDHYNKPKRTKYSLGVIFTKILLKDWVRKNLKNTTERTRRKKMQTKWKAEVQKHRIWLDFNDEFGCGALSLIPKQFRNTHGLRLNRPDEQELLLRIKAQHPNLKKDIEDLSFLMWHLLTYGVLPTQKLLLETLGELEIREMSQKNYRELLTFVDSPVRADVNGALEWPNPPHGNDDFSEDPAMLLQTAEQSAAEQQSAVAGSDSMRLLDELMEECIDPAVLGPNAAIPYVGAKM
ncbi:hypothetical protein J3458_021666 [Metarhizium acridum]|uniref:uncharacterized protein n=2 Tax=Metarhizium acridum TaxID=92637 RepID=UPI001C6B52F8|nr:hypothetical protein J3458_021666 [Metarhizium acridum]